MVAVAMADPGWLYPFMVVLPPLKVKPDNIGLIVQTGAHPEIEKLMVSGPGLLLADVIAALRDPAPLLLVLVTV